jgi:putative transposase
MEEMGIAGASGRNRIRTTITNPDNPVAENLLERDFTATAPNQRWVTDITAISTEEGSCISLRSKIFARVK